MRVAFDLDGVLADLHGAFSRTARELFPALDEKLIASPSTGASPPVGEGDETVEIPGVEARPELGRQQVTAVWDRLTKTENFWESLDEIESGAVKRLHALATERAWEVIFLTSRPFAPGHTVQRQTQRWLQAKGFTLPSVFVVQQARGRMADAFALDVVVDDRPEGCLDVVLESKARAILLWRNELTAVPASAKRLGIGVVPSVAACLDALVEADQAASTGEGFVARLRRVLGLAPKNT